MGKLDAEMKEKCSWCGQNAKFEYMWGDMGHFFLCRSCAKNVASNVVNDILSE